MKKTFREMLLEGSRTSAEHLVKLLNSQKGEPYKARWGMAWDRADIKKARVTTINRGKGFEQGIFVNISSPSGTYLYLGPFEIYNFPAVKGDSEEMLLFDCGDATFFKENL